MVFAICTQDVTRPQRSVCLKTTQMNHYYKYLNSICKVHARKCKKKVNFMHKITSTRERLVYFFIKELLVTQFCSVLLVAQWCTCATIFGCIMDWYSNNFLLSDALKLTPFDRAAFLHFRCHNLSALWYIRTKKLKKTINWIYGWNEKKNEFDRNSW